MPIDSYELLATAILVGYDHSWKDGVPKPIKYEPEAVWFPTIKGLAIQWHPEYLNDAHPSQVYVQQLFDEFIGVTENV